ncbi:hypothetical protein TVAG_036270 [Trichomonas vaginalis G3]|uniref:Uncharacterized protein n=1 Tax=Trichomonas vaginalis (strain ATCC PRA-98 / G3) TaxID=412133 RepID=A2DAU9_TRIV3|nr:hypothetical protein TVAGG3_0812800 [Trichomonas vaginalis G3]EAY22602.1 hypothetical protein TVAG_036270 [Trichomonas vaginalis G3]KAI5497334.1 hypothetical protein TVAGG3_0812800 [Trichomonas vaginalis G3]|eukprot:XP_001583588.1 hypothetical protein [Trichomonas vaginalis G3]
MASMAEQLMQQRYLLLQMDQHYQKQTSTIKSRIEALQNKANPQSDAKTASKPSKSTQQKITTTKRASPGSKPK